MKESLSHAMEEEKKAIQESIAEHEKSELEKALQQSMKDAPPQPTDFANSLYMEF